MESVIMYPENQLQLSALKAFAKALKVSFETSPYNPKFVNKIKQSKQQVEEGRFITPDPEKSIWKI